MTFLVPVTVKPAFKQLCQGDAASMASLGSAIPGQSNSGTNPMSGDATIQSQDATLVYGSPALIAAPTFRSGSQVNSAWGLGWSSSLDQFIQIDSSGTLQLADGSGAIMNYYQLSATSTTIVYASPTTVYSTMTAVSLSSGSPTSVQQLQPDGTTLTFSVASSSWVLYLSGLTDRVGNTITYTRNGSGQLTEASDVHGRHMNLSYTSGYVTTLTDSGSRTFTYAYDGSGHKTSETGPQGTTSYTYDGNNRITKITYPNSGVHDYSYDGQGRVSSEDDGTGVGTLTYTYNSTSTVVTDALSHTVTYEYRRFPRSKAVVRLSHLLIAVDASETPSTLA